MKAETITRNSNGVSDVTTEAIVYDDPLLHTPSTAEEISPARLAKRLCSLSELFLASSLVALTTPTLSLPDIRLYESAPFSTSMQIESGLEKRRGITLREARQIALRAHYQFEEGLRNDRIQEVRLMEIAAYENDA